MTQIEKDIESVIKKSCYFEAFVGKSVLVTGATGLIGSILIKSLINFGNIKVYANCRSEEKFKKLFFGYQCENLIPIYSDILNLDVSSINIDFVVHGASITDSKTFVEKPVETIFTAIDGTRNLLNQFKHKKLEGFVYLSSLEVYGSFNDQNGIVNVSENMAGYINCLAVRSSYSEGKRMVENICCSYASEYKIPVKIARLCQTFGAGVEYYDNRVFAQFARAVIELKDIVLKTKGETVRNYCYTTDAVTGILTVLDKGEIGEAYNIANPDTTVSIYDMAELCCTMNNRSKVVFDIALDATKLGYNPVVKLELNPHKLYQLGWKPEVDLKTMYERLIVHLKESTT